MMTQAAVGLFFKPGLGKTSTSLAAITVLKSKGLAKKTLVVAPLRVCQSVWPNEIEKWAEFNHLTCSLVHGKDKEEALQVDADLYLINPEGLLWLLTKGLHLFNSIKFDVLIIDESTKFKSHASKRFKLLKSHLPNFNRRWILTGSPAPQGAIDLWSQIYVLDQGNALGRFITHFRSKFFHQPNPYKRMYEFVLNPGAMEEIIRRIDPLVIYVSPEEYLTLPELIKVEVPVVVDEETMSRYRQVEDEFITTLKAGGLVVAENAAAAGTKCRQIANGAVFTEVDGVPIDSTRAYEILHDEKLDALEELVEEIPDSILVSYEFQHDRERILARFPQAVHLNSKETVEQFMRGEIKIGVAHPASAGHGLNLQANCSSVVFFGLTWNFEYYEQLIARVWRQGQASSRVMVYHIVAKGTLDERVIKVLKGKEATQMKILESLTGE